MKKRNEVIAYCTAFFSLSAFVVTAIMYPGHIDENLNILVNGFTGFIVALYGAMAAEKTITDPAEYEFGRPEGIRRKTLFFYPSLGLYGLFIVLYYRYKDMGIEIELSLMHIFSGVFFLASSFAGISALNDGLKKIKFF